MINSLKIKKFIIVCITIKSYTHNYIFLVYDKYVYTFIKMKGIFCYAVRQFLMDAPLLKYIVKVCAKTYEILPRDDYSFNPLDELLHPDIPKRLNRAI